MKVIHILLLSLIFNQVFSQDVQEQEITTNVNEVTVFLDGAQIVREKTVHLTKGKTILKFINLSPFIDAKSVQVKAEGALTVLSVNHQQNYLDKMEKSAVLTDLEAQLEGIEENINLENTHLSIIQEELVFLKENRVIGGKNEQVSMINLQQAADFYGQKLTALKMKEIERRKTLTRLNNKKRDLQYQIRTLTSKKDYPKGEDLVKVDVTQNNTFSLELTYLVGNAGWYPSYDIRAKNIDEPVQLIYKANVKQDTKADWTNVTLRFSSADPNVSGLAPELQTYYLDYNILPPTYRMTSNSVRGTIVDGKGEPLAGANVVVEGTTIGTVSDLDGRYSITIPNASSRLTYSFIGFNSKTLAVTSDVMNVALEESAIELQEVLMVGAASKKTGLESLQGRMAGVSMDKSIKIRGASSLAVPTVQNENQTTVDFEIKMPYTIKSDNKNYAVDMAVYDLPAFYQYYSIPKIDKDAFLIANIIDWEKYNLLEGEANVFFEGTYVGKTLLDVRYASDTLEISLGRDKKVSVSREKIKDYTNKQFFGNKKEETRAWKTSVRNNKNKAINMIVLDQVPVSIREDIVVDVQAVSAAKHNAKSGEIKWEFELPSNETKDFELRYSVKYPKNRNLVIE